eukprot:scaffold108671_cov27-Tisochrysis_lutea.AAC.3
MSSNLRASTASSAAATFRPSEERHSANCMRVMWSTRLMERRDFSMSWKKGRISSRRVLASCANRAHTSATISSSCGERVGSRRPLGGGGVESTASTKSRHATPVPTPFSGVAKASRSSIWSSSHLDELRLGDLIVPAAIKLVEGLVSLEAMRVNGTREAREKLVQAGGRLGPRRVVPRHRAARLWRRCEDSWLNEPTGRYAGAVFAVVSVLREDVMRVLASGEALVSINVAHESNVVDEAVSVRVVAVEEQSLLLKRQVNPKPRKGLDHLGASDVVDSFGGVHLLLVVGKHRFDQGSPCLDAPAHIAELALEVALSRLFDRIALQARGTTRKNSLHVRRKRAPVDVDGAVRHPLAVALDEHRMLALRYG